MTQSDHDLETRRRRWALERMVLMTGDLVRCCISVYGASALSYAFGKEAVHAARALGWWAEEHDVPLSALEAARHPPPRPSDMPGDLGDFEGLAREPQ